MGATLICIGLCTYRRESLRDTLASLARLEVPEDTRIALIIADNDETPSARARVAQATEGFAMPVTYLHAPAHNISVARNAILSAARAQGAGFLAFLDDDETVAPDWLVKLYAQAQQTRAAAVLGPVRAGYLPQAPGWMQRGRVHDTEPKCDSAGWALTGYTCNTLIDLAHPASVGLSFDPARGRSGGEDTAFFAALSQAGGRIAYAPDAIARETVPEARARLGWLLRRRFRMGQTHGSLLAEGRGMAGRLAQAGLAGAKALACLGLALIGLLDPLRRNSALTRASLHLGVIAALLGMRAITLYGQAAAAQHGPPQTPEARRS